MKSVAFGFWILTVSACTSLPEKQSLVGTFSHSSVDAEAQIQLMADGTYGEYFLDGTHVVTLPGGEAGIPREERSGGRWELRGRAIVLLPRVGSTRILKVTQKEGCWCCVNGRWRTGS